MLTFYGWHLILPSIRSFPLSQLFPSGGQSDLDFCFCFLPPCPSLSPKVFPSSNPLSRWSYPTISSSAAFFSFCLQSFPASGSFLMSQFFASGGQSIGASASASVLPMSIQGWFPLGLTGLKSLLSKGLSGVFSSTAIQKHQFFSTQASSSNLVWGLWDLEIVNIQWINIID